ncbi:MAG: 30S ribosome-binding factor RbfA [Varibaculum sp.]|nr:30S ribosome-binding factor RbfA [Varibaculum sp.]
MADIARQRRVAGRIKQTVAAYLGNRIKDPRLGFVTVTDVRVTGDLQHAKVYWTALGSEGENRRTAEVLAAARGRIRSEVGRALGIRVTPSIEFIHDELPETSASFEETLAAARARDAELAAVAAGAEYAGEADPYKKPRATDDELADETDE